jgi:hypothetical protein
MKNGLILIIIGIIILMGIVFNVSIGFLVILEIIFGLVFIAEGLKIFKKPKNDQVGSLIFGTILILDAFKVLPKTLTFWQIILLLIASYLVGEGIYMLFFKGTLKFKFNKSPEEKEEKFEGDIPNNALLKKYDIENDFDWTKFSLNSSNMEEAVKIRALSDKDIFKKSFKWDSKDIFLMNKLKVSNIKIPERAQISIKLNREKEYSLIGTYNVCDVFLDMRDMKFREMNLKMTASKLVIIPSDKIDSIIDADFEITSVSLKMPYNVGLVLSQKGELNFKTFEGLEQRDDGTYISSNYSDAEFICYFNISSEISKINVQII